MKKRKQGTTKPAAARIAKLVVRARPLPHGRHSARLQWGQVIVSAVIGKAGISCRKREGDGASPAGAYDLRPGFFRFDRLGRIKSGLPMKPVSRRMGWSDAPRSGRYNRPVPAGSPESHETLWRDDHVYDVVIPTSHNQRPRILGAGSAIFLHLSRPDCQPTEGCVAIGLADMRRLLPRLGLRTRIIIKR